MPIVKNTLESSKGQNMIKNAANSSLVQATVSTIGSSIVGEENMKIMDQLKKIIINKKDTDINFNDFKDLLNMILTDKKVNIKINLDELINILNIFKQLKLSNPKDINTLNLTDLNNLKNSFFNLKNDKGQQFDLLVIINELSKLDVKNNSINIDIIINMLKKHLK